MDIYEFIVLSLVLSQFQIILIYIMLGLAVATWCLIQDILACLQ